MLKRRLKPPQCLKPVVGGWKLAENCALSEAAKAVFRYCCGFSRRSNTGGNLGKLVLSPKSYCAIGMESKRKRRYDNKSVRNVKAILIITALTLGLHTQRTITPGGQH